MILMDDLIVLCMEEMTQELSLQSHLNENIFRAMLAWAYLVSEHVYAQFMLDMIDKTCILRSLASQTWTFATILPLLIGHKIPEDDLHWECYLLLLQILQYSTARVSSLSSSLYLTALISQHHQIFVTCYPGVKLTTKMHYLIHFPQQICRYVCISIICLLKYM